MDGGRCQTVVGGPRRSPALVLPFLRRHPVESPKGYARRKVRFTKRSTGVEKQLGVQIQSGVPVTCTRTPAIARLGTVQKREGAFVFEAVRTTVRSPVKVAG